MFLSPRIVKTANTKTGNSEGRLYQDLAVFERCGWDADNQIFIFRAAEIVKKAFYKISTNLIFCLIVKVSNFIHLRKNILSYLQKLKTNFKGHAG